MKFLNTVFLLLGLSRLKRDRSGRGGRMITAKSLETNPSSGCVAFNKLLNLSVSGQSTLSHEITYRVCISVAPPLVFLGFPCGSAGKESPCNVGDLGLIPGLGGRSPGEGKAYPLQYSGLENSMDSIAHGVAKSQTPLSDFDFPDIKFTKLCHCHAKLLAQQLPHNVLNKCQLPFLLSCHSLTAPFLSMSKCSSLS